MRQHYYNFAHKILPQDVTTEASLWRIISSDKAASYLSNRWKDAAPIGFEEPSKGLIWIEPVRAFGIEVRVVRMPPPSDVSETYYGAIARSEDGAVRYFVAEKGGSAVFWAEWRKNMRLRGENLVETADAATNAVFTEAPSQSAPWEVSSSAIPGMPYLASFLMAVCTEMQNKAANEEAKKNLAAGPDVLPARGASAAPASNTRLIAIILAGVLLAIVLFARAAGAF